MKIYYFVCVIITILYKRCIFFCDTNHGKLSKMVVLITIMMTFVTITCGENYLFPLSALVSVSCALVIITY